MQRRSLPLRGAVVRPAWLCERRLQARRSLRPCQLEGRRAGELVPGQHLDDAADFVLVEVVETAHRVLAFLSGRARTECALETRSARADQRPIQASVGGFPE